jgi:hypothetical protein
MSKNQKPAAPVSTETKFNVNLGGDIYTLNFGTTTFLRIKEFRPSLSNAFNVPVEVDAAEIVAFLIYCAIKPEDRKWTSYEEFLEVYDNSEDLDSSKVLTGYQAGVKGYLKKVEPALLALQNLAGDQGK